MIVLLFPILVGGCLILGALFVIWFGIEFSIITRPFRRARERKKAEIAWDAYQARKAAGTLTADDRAFEISEKLFGWFYRAQVRQEIRSQASRRRRFW